MNNFKGNECNPKIKESINAHVVIPFVCVLFTNHDMIVRDTGVCIPVISIFCANEVNVLSYTYIPTWKFGHDSLKLNLECTSS